MSTVGGGQKLVAVIKEKMEKKKIKVKLLKALESDDRARDLVVEKFGDVDGKLHLATNIGSKVANFGQKVVSGAQNVNNGEKAAEAILRKVPDFMAVLAKNVSDLLVITLNLHYSSFILFFLSFLF